MNGGDGLRCFLPRLTVVDLPRRILRCGDDGIYLVLALKLELLLVCRPVDSGPTKPPLLPARSSMRVQQPVFLGCERSGSRFPGQRPCAMATDCTRPADRPRRTLLQSSGLKLIADDAVQNAARLLCVDQIVDRYRAGLAMLSVHYLFGDLIKGYTAGSSRRGASRSSLRCHADRFALAVRVGSEIHRSGLFAERFFSSLIIVLVTARRPEYTPASKPCSMSTPSLLFGKSRRWPMDAITL